MNDQALSAQWRTLDPTAAQAQRIEHRVFDWLDAYETSLLSQWFGLIKIRPAATLVYGLGSALSLLLISPSAGLMFSLFG